MTVPPGPSLADALISSPILAGEGGAMLGLGASDFEFGVDPSADPELALVSGTGRQCALCCAAPGCATLSAALSPSLQALRVSMEEQRQRQEEEARRAAAASAAEAGIAATGGDGEELHGERSCSGGGSWDAAWLLEGRPTITLQEAGAGCGRACSGQNPPVPPHRSLPSSSTLELPLAPTEAPNPGWGAVGLV